MLSFGHSITAVQRSVQCVTGLSCTLPAIQQLYATSNIIAKDVNKNRATSLKLYKNKICIR